MTESKRAGGDRPGVLRVLLVDDNPDDRALVLRTLEREFPGVEVQQIAEERALEQAVEAGDFDLAITDYQLRFSDGLQILRRVKSRRPNCPVLMFTGTGSEEIAVEAMKSGLDDYIVKTARHYARLPAAVRTALERAAEREATRAAQRARDRFFSVCPELLCALDLEGRFIQLNPAWRKLLGHSLGELRGRPLLELIHPDDRERAGAEIDRVRRGGFSTEFECRVQTQERSYRWLGWSGMGVPEEGLLYAAASDVTQSRQALERLEARARQQAAVAALGQRALAGAGLQELMDQAAEQVRATLSVDYAKVLELLPDQRRLLVRAGAGWPTGVVGQETVGIETDSQAGYTLEQNEPVILADAASECRFKLPDLLIRHRVQSGLSVPIRGRTRPYGVLGAHSCQAREFGEDDAHYMMAIANVLGAVIEQRRTEEQLQQALKLEALGRLASGVAHDFNNLLVVILGYATLLTKQLPAAHPGYQQAVEILSSAQRAAGLTRQLLAFSRQQVLEPRIIDPVLVVRDAERMLRPLIGEDIELAVVVGPAPGRVHADPGQLGQALINLAINSRDAMPEGGRLRISVENVEVTGEHARQQPQMTPGSYVVFGVSDTGQGMDAQTQARIFEPFFTTKPEGKGTGLGLPMVYGFVQQSGGFLHVYSEPGHGTLFKVYLPRVDAEPEVAPADGAVPERLQGSETILLVEDQETIRRLLVEVLAEHGYRVLVAAHGEEALLVAGAYPAPIDLVVTDVVMPKLGGRMLTQRLLAQRPDLRVLLISGYPDETLGGATAFAGGGHYLQKPFTTETLLRKVRELLSRPPGR